MRAIFGMNAGVCVVIGMMGAGCTTVPPLPPVGGEVAIHQVVDRVQCEVYEAISELKDVTDDRGVKQYDWIVNYVAKATLALQINSDGGITPEVSLLGPFNTGTFSLGFGGGLSAGANRTATYGFLIDFRQAQDFLWCREKEKYRGYPPLQGELGFREWFTNVLRSHDDNDPFPRPDSLTHKLDFIMEGSLKVSPAYALARSKGNAALVMHRKDTHSLEIVMVYVPPKDPKDPGYQKVCVVNMPGPCQVEKQIVIERQPAHRPAKKSPRISVQPRTAAPPARPRTREISPDVRQRLDRLNQELQLRTIVPRL